MDFSVFSINKKTHINKLPVCVFEQHATSKILVFTIINLGYIHFALNFILRIKQLKMFEKMLFVCTDEASFNILKEFSYIQCILYTHSLVTQEFVVWKNKKYTDLVFNKFDITKTILEHALMYKISNVLYIDTDIWFFKNFENDLINFKNQFNNIPDIIFQDGENYKTHPKKVEYIIKKKTIIKSREIERYCTGFMLMNPSTKLIELFNYKNSTVDFLKFKGNQPYLNAVLKTTKNIEALVLDRDFGVNGSIFNNEDGEPFLTNKECKNCKKIFKTNNTWFLHYTYCVGYDKINKMKLLSNWLL